MPILGLATLLALENDYNGGHFYKDGRTEVEDEDCDEKRRMKDEIEKLKQVYQRLYDIEEQLKELEQKLIDAIFNIMQFYKS